MSSVTRSAECLARIEASPRVMTTFSTFLKFMKHVFIRTFLRNGHSLSSADVFVSDSSLYCGLISLSTVLSCRDRTTASCVLTYDK